MQLDKDRGAPLVADHQFILATRSTGYRSLTAALAELIDNAIQADARIIRIFINEDRQQGHKEITIGVLDDGCGMDKHTLVKALQFGGSNRFDDRSGFGRFGMGLPNSSVSQSRRLEVYTWRANSRPLHTYIDVDRIANRSLRTIPTPQQAILPAWAHESSALQGTLVVWSRCDRVAYKKAVTIAAKLAPELSRIYRYPLWQGLKLYVNGIRLNPFDPLYLAQSIVDAGAMQYGPPLTYDLHPNGYLAGRVSVRFTELPVNQWHGLSIEEKRKRGIVGGAGVSIVRAGREIDYGWHLMGGKRRENYDDWWRCEISFDPALDELFGVTHSKQGITPTIELKSILEADMEGVARELNAKVRAAFENVRASHTRAAKLAEESEIFLPPFVDKEHRLDSGKRSYRIAVGESGERDFYSITNVDNELILTINRDHPFFEKIYGPACKEDAKYRTHLECLLLAVARAEVISEHKTSQGSTLEFRQTWSDTLAAFLERL